MKKARGLMALYRAARRAPWWLRKPRLVVERRYFDPAGDPGPALGVPYKAPA